MRLAASPECEAIACCEAESPPAGTLKYGEEPSIMIPVRQGIGSFERNRFYERRGHPLSNELNGGGL
jgi:hypothetical protein